MKTCIKKSIFATVILTSLLLSGCVNLPAVRAFSDETKKTSAMFNPMLGGSVESCQEKYKRKKLISSKAFDPELAENYAKQLCKPIDESNKTIASLNSLLELYADTLASLADEKLPSYKDEYGGLTDALGKVKKTGSQEALLEDAKLNAIGSLANFLSKAATQHSQKKAIMSLLDHEDAISAITQALSDYATYNYKSWLEDEIKEMDSLRKSLDISSKTEPLASNYFKAQLLSEERKIDQRKKAIDAYVKAVAALNTANSELHDNLTSRDEKVLARQISEFAKEVSSLNKQISEAF